MAFSSEADDEWVEAVDAGEEEEEVDELREDLLLLLLMTFGCCCLAATAALSLATLEAGMTGDVLVSRSS